MKMCRLRKQNEERQALVRLEGQSIVAARHTQQFSCNGYHAAAAFSRS
jgi:hypothetical protein